MIRAGRRMDILVFCTIIITVLFFCFSPAIFPGFPNPTLAGTNITYAKTTAGALQVYLKTTVTNEGTRGNVVITLKLVNASSHSTKQKSSVTVFLQPGEKRIISQTMSAWVNEPYDVVVEAQRK
jgi:hypothetical protein